MLRTKAIILAAGRGLRLALSEAEPAKCLLKLGGMTLIERQIAYLRAAGIAEIVIVVGFEAEQVRRVCGPKIEYVENSVYAETNSMYSLWLARHLFADGFIVLNSDVLFHPQLLVNLIAAPHEDAILVSYRNGTKYGAEEMKVKVREGCILDISKSMDPDQADGENVGIVKFGPAGAAVLAGELEGLVAKSELRSWAPRAFLEFSKKRPLPVVATHQYPWIEIDFPEDLQRARAEILPQLPELIPLHASAAADEGT